tara:strand:- start:607 stop:762 length:156 start_codon:yes stop_codon:yes gene_type:complete
MSSNILGLPAENSSLSMTVEWGVVGFRNVTKDGHPELVSGSLLGLGGVIQL